MSHPTDRKTVRHIATIAAAAGALTVIFHWGFNAAIPALFDLPEASFKQSLGLLLMASVMALVFQTRRGFHPTGGRHGND